MSLHPVRRAMRIGTFWRKEVVDVVHQPRLLITLVAGPFLVMALFGVGYSDATPKMRTLFVAPDGSEIAARVPEYAAQIGNYVVLAGVTSDLDAARASLQAGRVDLVVAFPDDPLGSVLAGKRAKITVLHARLDPIEQTAIEFATRIAVDQIDAAILAGIVGGGQGLARPATGVIDEAVADASAVAAAVSAGDANAASSAYQRLTSATTAITVSAAAVRSASAQLGAPTEVAALASTDPLAQLQRQVAALDGLSDPDAVAKGAAAVHATLDAVRAQLVDALHADPAVLVQPFDSEVRLVVPDVHRASDWYAPAAVVLMLQQFGVAFGALSFVRERRLGITDVFRVAPVGATDAVVGKYVAYLMIGGGLGAALVGLVVGALRVPFHGGVGDVAVAMALTLVASIGLGLVISLASASDAQAVQYTMILLLASLFFSGFFLTVDRSAGVAQVVGWLLPVTFGMRMLRDAMLRGTHVATRDVVALAGYGALMFVAALAGAKRRMGIAR